MTRKRAAILIVILVLIGLRLSLPFIVRWKANKTLASLEEYKGHIERVHLAIWRGAFELKDLSIEHRAGDMGLTIQRLAFQIVWSQLFKKHVVADILVESPRVRLLVPKPAQAPKKVKQKSQAAEKEVEAKTGKSLPDLLASLVPFQIRSFELTEGTVRVQEPGQDLNALEEKDKDIKPHSEKANQPEQPMEARVTHLNMKLENLTNAPELAGSSNAEGHMSAQIMENGQFKMRLKINPTAKRPTFDVAAALTHVDLRNWNALLRWQSGIDVAQGTFAMYLEAHAGDGRFKGYIKPFFHDVEMHDAEQDKNKGLGKKIKETVVDIVTGLFENSDTENVASRIPFEGQFGSPNPGIWEAVITVLRNGFIEALKPGLDRSKK